MRTGTVTIVVSGELVAEVDVDIQVPVSTPVASLTIAEIETIAIRVPLTQTYHGSAYKMTHRSTIVTRIRTEEGIVGEAYCGDEDAGLLEIDAILRTEIAPRLLGEDAFRVERCWELARPATFDILRDRRLGLVATACVDAAIWDAIGKALGQPLHRLWGGYRDTLPVITIGGYYGVRRHRGRGLGAPRAGPRRDEVQGRRAERPRRTRSGSGPRAPPPAPTSSSAPTRTRAGRRPRRSGSPGSSRTLTSTGSRSRARWSNDRRAMRDVRFAGGVRVCAGQSEFSAGGCRDLMVEGAIDVCNFDSSWSGGPTEWRRVAAAAVCLRRRDGAPRGAPDRHPPARLHPARDVPRGVQRRRAIRSGGTSSPTGLPIVDGLMVLPSAPGLGWELDGDYIEAYRITPHP